MIDFGDVLRNAEGGRALDHLAEQFQISKEEANAAVEALTPSLSNGLMSRGADAAGLLSLIGTFGEGQPLAAFADPTATSIARAEKGADAVRVIFGSDAAGDEIALRAASATGLEPGLLSKMLPVIASMVISAITNALQSRGLGGILTELAKAVGQGGLGTILGQVLGGGQARANPLPPQGSPPAPGGGIDLGTILGQVLGGGRGPASPPPQGSTPAPGGGIDLGTILGQVLSGGRGPASPSPQGSPPAQGGGIDLGAILEQVLGGGRGPASPPPQGSTPAPGGGIDLGSILEQVLGGGQGQASPPPQESAGPQGGLEEEIGQILGGKRT